MSSNASSSGAGVLYYGLHDYAVTIYFLVINACIVVLAGFIIGLNLLVLHILLKLPSREPTDVFICGLATADALTGIFLLYNTAYNLINFQIFLECAFRMGFIQLVFISSMFFMSALTIDRYIKIVRPFHYTTVCNAVSVVVMSVIIWAVSIAIGLLPVMGWNKRTSAEDVSQDPPCGFFAVFDKNYLSFVVILFASPIILMACLYLHIFKIASRHARAIQCHDKMVKEVPFRDRHSWRYTKTVLIIVGVYLLCWFPSGIVIVLHVDGRLGNRTTLERGNLILYASAIAYFNSLANPIIYAVKIPAVRKHFRKVFCRKSANLDSTDQRRTEKSDTDRSRGFNTQMTSLSTSGIEEVPVTN